MQIIFKNNLYMQWRLHRINGIMELWIDGITDRAKPAQNSLLVARNLSILSLLSIPSIPFRLVVLQTSSLRSVSEAQGGSHCSLVVCEAVAKQKNITTLQKGNGQRTTVGVSVGSQLIANPSAKHKRSKKNITTLQKDNGLRTEAAAGSMELRIYGITEASPRQRVMRQALVVLLSCSLVDCEATAKRQAKPVAEKK